MVRLHPHPPGIVIPVSCAQISVWSRGAFIRIVEGMPEAAKITVTSLPKCGGSSPPSSMRVISSAAEHSARVEGSNPSSGFGLIGGMVNAADF